MKYYTDTIPYALAEKLKEKGMPIRYEQRDEGVRPMTMFCEVFDWFLDLGYDVEVYLSMTGRNKADGTTQRLYAWVVGTPNNIDEATSTDEEYYSWHKAANAAIEKALTLI